MLGPCRHGEELRSKVEAHVEICASRHAEDDMDAEAREKLWEQIVEVLLPSILREWKTDSCFL